MSQGIDASLPDQDAVVTVDFSNELKAAVVSHIRRSLRPGGRFGLYEQMRVAEGPITYPLPWAEDERSSFVDGPDHYARALEAVGFTIEKIEDRTAVVGRAGAPDGPNPAAVFGPAFVERITNNVAATRAGVLAPIVIIARAI